MLEITWRYDPDAPFVERVPETLSDAIAMLNEGNAAFAALDAGSGGHMLLPVTPEDLGLGPAPGAAPRQAPFAAVLGCADARVPLELLLSQAANDLFVVRVAGNVLAAECAGSLDYAVTHIDELRLLAVVGHTGCGAVAAAVDAYLDPTTYLGMTHNLDLRSIIDAIVAAVRGADASLHAVHGDQVSRMPGYRAALLDSTVVLNAAIAADVVRARWQAALGDRLGVAFGVYDLASRRVGLPTDAAAAGPWSEGLLPPPQGDGLESLMRTVAASSHVVGLLASAPAETH